MACACGGGKKSATETFVVVLPGGKMKSYLSRAAAEATVSRTPGAYLKPSPASSS